MTDAPPPRPDDGAEIPILAVKNLFQNVQHCVDHPTDPACDTSGAPSP
jgi:hypothetical protein